MNIEVGDFFLGGGGLFTPYWPPRPPKRCSRGSPARKFSKRGGGSAQILSLRGTMIWCIRLFLFVFPGMGWWLVPILLISEGWLLLHISDILYISFIWCIGLFLLQHNFSNFDHPTSLIHMQIPTFEIFLSSYLFCSSPNFDCINFNFELNISFYKKRFLKFAILAKFW